MCPQANGTYFKIMKYLLTTTIAAVPLATTSLADPIHDFVENSDLAGVQVELNKGGLGKPKTPLFFSGLPT